MAVMEHDDEPIPGLPARLPPGERILWQGRPDWWRLARSAFHLRAVALYFAFWFVLGLSGGTASGLVMTLAAGAAGVGILALLAWAMARSTLYTITNRRVVLRFGVALPLCVNLPMVKVASARLDLKSDGSGDIALELTPDQRAGYLTLWPYVRPWRFARPEPTLRAIPDVRLVAELLARALAEAVPGGRRLPLADGPDAAPVPAAGALA
ncbi:MAG: photosynthetic complex putative assembly protein PuhB [Sphingomonadaceae bacterium]|uniref:photosynthetic complex putative assembly protein PuhB n=1 Tax=Thermaurantiacus sp. TaxID=2820283 RepID=UPI00298EF5AA|nr:photosynthetic complex putative assembly protein PuhB [Thermaurantiacus sp.]MCS6987807.1 photosynthetic complex putative assembly protein PuhB [Sphingomonadaceae bacterium]MDW8414973.1 photosynthetic complex putative assembly protein PuhB [Thermaurantiacus sp.]